MALHNPLPLSADERTSFLGKLPDLTPHDTGAHLLAAWNWVRMKSLFVAWQPQTAAFARKVDAPAPVRIHAEVREVLRCGARFRHLWEHALSVDFLSAFEALERSGVNTKISADDDAERQRLLTRMTVPAGQSLQQQGRGEQA
jgi:hypothetical protein